MRPTPLLASSLEQLDALLVSERAELESQPRQLEALLQLRAQLGRLKPGQVPPAETMRAVARFLREQLAAEERSLKSTVLPLAPTPTAAKASALAALNQARAATRALDPDAPAAALEDAATRLANANAKGEALLSAARAHQALPVAGPAKKGAHR